MLPMVHDDAAAPREMMHAQHPMMVSRDTSRRECADFRGIAVRVPPPRRFVPASN
jgi:hypothetical protein